jgi:ADP-heptose:LPS heptosyltransferase
MRVKFPSSEQVLYLANVLANRLWFNQNPKTLNSILVLRWDEIGDMAASAHVFAAIKKSFPNARLTVLCKPFVQPLIENDPSIDEVLCSIDDFNKHYDAVIEMRGTWKTFWKSFRYGVKYRTSRAEVRLRNKGNQLHETITNAETVWPITGNIEIPQTPLYYSKVDETVVDQFLEENQIKRFAVVHAGARKKLRQWPKERFAKAVDYLKNFYQLDIVFAGTVEDEADIEDIKKDLNFQTHKFTQGYSLSQFSILCKQATIYLGNESGPLQIASAMGIPVIGLFGPGVPDIFYPLSPKSIVIHHILECNPCDQIHCVQPENPCIEMITNDQVRGAINEILH